MADVEIRPLTLADMGETRHALSRAFDDDPFFWWMMPGPRRRYFGLRAVMGAPTVDCIRHGEAYAAVEPDGRIVGSAAWLPPGAYPLTNGRQAREMASMFSIGPMFPGRMGPSLKLLGAMTKKHPKVPHWYLAVLGVDPSRWRRGVGGRLLEPVLERIDEEGLPAYLETQNDKNLAFYGRLGWEVTEVLEVPPVPKLWLMWREPRTR